MSLAASFAGLRAPLEAERIALDGPKTGPLAVYGAGPEGAAATPLVLVHSVNAAASAYEVKPVFDHYARTRPTYAFDLPGFGLSDRSDRPYTPRLMTDAVRAVVAEVRSRHGGAPVDALALSLGCEFLARAASDDDRAFRSLGLVSPTGLDGRGRREGPAESTRAVPGLHGILRFSLWDDALFGGLTRPSVIRYFLERTFGQKTIDEGLWAYDVLTTRVPGAKYAPLRFVSGHLFSADAFRLYDRLERPVWMCQGVRGDFVDYRGADAMRGRENWRFTVLQTGALPWFEVPDEFFAAYDRFLASA